MDINLESQVAVITGSGTGIGYATAELFALAGCAVIINGRRKQVCEEAAQRIIQHGGRAAAVVADASTIAGAQALADAALAQ
ncbi:MAG TPA: SDR family NAD(P)-dependent oxidoreductase, partial [Anaerolineae bacterium]